jgi:hypothetical protein
VKIYKFFTDRKLKYIVRAEMYKNETFTVKYYAAIHKRLDNKYSRLTEQYNASKIFKTCISIFSLLFKEYPSASFAINGSRTIDIKNDKIEGEKENQRFRIYAYIIDKFVGHKTFEHYVFPELSSYVLVNKKTDAHKDKIRDMFLNLFRFDDEV